MTLTADAPTGTPADRVPDDGGTTPPAPPAPRAARRRPPWRNPWRRAWFLEGFTWLYLLW